MHVTTMHVARRRFGQNFLVDPGTIGKIVAAIAPQPGDRVVEIGPGRAALTGPLLERLPVLDVVEIDRDLVAALQGRFPAERLRVHQCDALKFDFCTLGGQLRVVGNLPYNISSPLLFHLAGSIRCLRDCHFMLQREVVERMAADPGGREYGRLSVMLQYRFRVEKLFRVSPGCFRPAPKVESAFVRLTPLDPLPWPARDEEVLASLVARAFTQRRKTLRNALREALNETDYADVGIDPGLRPEALSVRDFVALANRLSSRQAPRRDAINAPTGAG